MIAMKCETTWNGLTETSQMGPDIVDKSEHISHITLHKGQWQTLSYKHLYNNFFRRSIRNIDRRYSGKEEKKDLQLYARLSMKAKKAMKRNHDIETTGQVSK